MKADSTLSFQLPSLPGRPGAVVGNAADSFEGTPTQLRAIAPASAPAPAVAAQQSESVAEVARVAAEAKQRLAETGSELTIEFNDDLGRMIFKIVDKETKEVLRQVPTEEALAVARALAGGDTVGALMRGSA